MFNRKKKTGFSDGSSTDYGAVNTAEVPGEENGGEEAPQKVYKKIGNFTLKDHFSLQNPTSAVRFQDDDTVVFCENTEQITLEKKKDEDFIVAKQATVSSPGYMALRFAYTLVTIFMTGLLFVFCVQLVLFLFLGLAIESGMTSSQEDMNTFVFMGTFFAIPVFVNGLSQAMTIAHTFIIDTWKGSKFMKTVISWDSVLIDWISFLVFFGFPVIFASGALFAGLANWWEVTVIVWFSFVVLYFAVFAISAIYYEVDGCLELIRYHKNLRDQADVDEDDRSIRTFRRAMALRLKQILSGYETVTYTASGSDKSPDSTDYGDVLEKSSLATYRGFYGWLTMQGFMDFFFDPLDEPVRQYNIDDVLEFTPLITNNTWSLESMYCRDRTTRFVAIVDGQGALTRAQMNSSLACYIFGSVMTLFFLLGLFHWMGVSNTGLIVVAVLFLLATFGSIRAQVGLRGAYNHVENTEIDRNLQSHALYQVQEVYRISEPRQEMIWLFLIVGITFFAFIPIVALYSSGNTRIATIFVLLAATSVLRSVCNAPACLQELGSLDGIEVNNEQQDARSEWREKHRLGKIVTEISVGKRSNFWTAVFIFTVSIFCLIFLSAVVLGADNGAEEKLEFAGKTDFFYNGSHSLNYASCSLTNNIKSPDGEENSLSDFAFLTAIAYLGDEYALDAATQWFNAEVNLNTDVVQNFQTEYQKTHASSVKYKLFEFPEIDVKIVSVRGTANSWDTLTDAQLWDGAMFSQYVRSFLPLGQTMWNPLLPWLVKAISLVESHTLKDVAYYRETTAFVNHLKHELNYTDVEIIGHSLGGGLAMITGAQTQTPSIGLSGPNAKMSRYTFYPNLNLEDLDKYTFNIIPDRDPVPRIDDTEKNYQRIACRSAANRPVDCHYGRRSLCEILYTCGSEGRPIPCFCANEYDYPQPESINGMSYSDVCPM